MLFIWSIKGKTSMGNRVSSRNLKSLIRKWALPSIKLGGLFYSMHVLLITLEYGKTVSPICDHILCKELFKLKNDIMENLGGEAGEFGGEASSLPPSL